MTQKEVIQPLHQNEAPEDSLDRRAFLTAVGAGLAAVACGADDGSELPLGTVEQSICASWPPTDGSVALLQQPKYQVNGAWPPSSFPDSVLNGGGPQGYVIGANHNVTLTCANPDTVEVGCLIVEGTLTFDPNTSVTLTSWGNIIVRGTGKIVMKPANKNVTHTIQFKNIDESKVKGGMVMPPVSPDHDRVRNDVGLWVLESGKLELAGPNVPQRKGWVRALDDASWEAGDSLRVAPVAEGDYGGLPNGASWKAFSKGAASPPAPPAVPTVNAGWAVFTTEVFNVTRNVIIQGQPDDASGGHKAHIIFMCDVPQTITQVKLQNLGPKGTVAKPLGRYALHFHMCGNATNGSLVEGVVAVSVANKGFVPHASHGITFRDCIAFSCSDIPYWWDPSPAPGSDYTNGSRAITFEHCAAFGIWAGGAGFYFEDGPAQFDSSNRCIDCVVVGITTGGNSGGFWWPGESARSRWTVQGCVAHNNAGSGAYNWWNTTGGPTPFLENFTAYRNALAGVFHGAYSNFFQYRGLKCYQNGAGVVATACNNAPVSGRTVFSGLTLDGGGNHICWSASGHIADATLPQLYVGTTGSTTFLNPAVLNGKPTYIHIEELVNGHTKLALMDFLRITVKDNAGSPVRDLQPGDFTVNSMAAGSVYRIEQRDGKSYELRMIGGVPQWQQISNNAITQDPRAPQPPPPPP